MDAETGRRRRVHALIFTAVYSRHKFVWLTYAQTLSAVIAGCEAAWAFFGGVFKVLIPDNLKPVVTDADALNPRLSVGWLEYTQHAGFATDTARVHSPKDRSSRAHTAPRNNGCVTMLNATLPLLSVLIGSAITYWLNVRARQRSHVDDVFREAIAAVAVASSRRKWLSNFEWDDAPQEETDQLLLESNRAGSQAWAQAVNEARAAVARASVYDPSLTQYYRGSTRWFLENPDTVIGQLRKHL